MGLIQESDLGGLFNNQALMEEIVSGLVEDSNTMDQLAEDAADKLQDVLEDDSEMRRRLVNAAVASDVFKRKLIAKLIEGLK